MVQNRKLVMNRPSVLAATIMLLACSGCVHTTALQPVSRQQRAEVNGFALGRTVAVTLVSGEEVHARAFHLSSDIASWIEGYSVRSVPHAEVVRVRVLDKPRGALEGALFGVAAAGLTGVVIGFVAEGDEYFSSAFVGGVAGVVAVLPLAIAGGIGGGAVGSKVVYETDAGSESPRPE